MIANIQGLGPGMVHIGATSVREVWRAQPSTVRLRTIQPSCAKASAELALHTGAIRRACGYGTTADGSRRSCPRGPRDGQSHPHPARASRLTARARHPDPQRGWAMAPIVGGQWKEIRTLAVGPVQLPVATSEGPVIQTIQRSYFSRMTDSTAALTALSCCERGGATRSELPGSYCPRAQRRRGAGERRSSGW